MRFFKISFFLALYSILTLSGIYAQVTIGSSQEPMAGALLDLTEGATTTKGLSLPRVKLTNQTDITSGDISGVNSSNKDLHIGLVVYNTNRCLTKKRDGIGIFVWDGNQWEPIGNNWHTTVTGKSGRVYRTARFGDAGEWMIDNLAETEYELPEVGTITASNNPLAYDALKHYYYPTNNSSYSGVEATDRVFYDLHKDTGIGLLYTWNAATNGVYDSEYSSAGKPAKPTVTVQGICPSGWYVPSDYDFGLLDKEMSLHPEKYSNVTAPTVWDETSTGYWKASTSSSWYGSQAIAMKSECYTPGTSSSTGGKSTINGFDIVFPGLILTGNPIGYGSQIFFWTSSSISSPSTSWYRGYQSANVGSGRGSSYKRANLHSVRCKRKGT